DSSRIADLGVLQQRLATARTEAQAAHEARQSTSQSGVMFRKQDPAGDGAVVVEGGLWRQGHVDGVRLVEGSEHADRVVEVDGSAVLAPGTPRAVAALLLPGDGV